MDETLLVLLLSLVVAPLWTGFEYLVKTAVEKCDPQAPPKMGMALTTASSHTVQLVMWWALVVISPMTSWVFDMAGWSETMLPRAWDTAERATLAPCYVIYFGFSWHSLVKDLRRSWGNLKSPDQLSFLLHHIITVLLVAGAFQVGVWRAGVLTRLIHDPADVFLYGSKFYQNLYDQGKGSRGVLSFLYILNNFVWFGTRVLLYGILVIYMIGTAKLALGSSGVDLYTKVVLISLLVGSVVMWLLQVIWMGALVAATRKFLRSKGKDTYDHLDVGQPDEDTEKAKKTKPLLSGQAA